MKITSQRGNDRSPSQSNPVTATSRRALALLAVAVLATLGIDVARADTVFAGSDVLFTPAGASSSVVIPPLPAGFFGPGSDLFPGVPAPGVPLMGLPLAGIPDSGPIGGYGLHGQSDTIVQRLTDAPIPCPGSVTIPIEIVALSLVSASPITVTFSGGASSSTYEVRVCLSVTTPQTPGMMTITHTNFDGGTFASVLPVEGRLIFTKSMGPGPGLVSPPEIDPHTVTLSTPVGMPGFWTHGTMGLIVKDFSGGGMVDHDCDPTSPMIPFPPSTNFYPGIGSFGGSCVNSGVGQKRRTAEEELLAKHGILPPNCPPGGHGGFGDGSMGNCPCGNNSTQPGRGCQHSESAGIYGGAGALLFATGSFNLPDDVGGGDTSLVLRAIDMRRAPTVCLFWQGTAGLGAGVFSGDGLRFVGGVLRRIGSKAGSNGKASYGALLGDIPVSIRGAVPPVGGTFFYQAAYRDGAPGFCTPESINWTNMVVMTWFP